MRLPHMGRGAAAGDLDNDGDQDLAVSLMNEPMALLNNKSGTNNSLVIRLIGRQSNRDAVGALVRVQITDEQPQMIRLVKSGGSYASSNDPRQFFGIGSATTVARVEVRWPGGIVQELKNVGIQEPLELIEPERIEPASPLNKVP